MQKFLFIEIYVCGYWNLVEHPTTFYFKQKKFIYDRSLRIQLATQYPKEYSQVEAKKRLSDDEEEEG